MVTTEEALVMLSCPATIAVLCYLPTNDPSERFMVVFDQNPFYGADEGQTLASAVDEASTLLKGFREEMASNIRSDLKGRTKLFALLAENGVQEVALEFDPLGSIKWRVEVDNEVYDEHTEVQAFVSALRGTATEWALHNGRDGGAIEIRQHIENLRREADELVAASNGSAQ